MSTVAHLERLISRAHVSSAALMVFPLGVLEKKKKRIEEKRKVCG